MKDVWVVTMVRPPATGISSSWQLALGGVGSLAEPSDGLMQNAGDVWDCWYEYAAVERMPVGIIVPCMAAEETRWFRLYCPSGEYGSATAEACDRPSLAFENADLGHALCTMLGTHRIGNP